jgi:hypothetical protein
MRPDRTQRRAAALFVAIGLPAAGAVVIAGGAVALAPLLLLVLPILAVGRAPGIEALDRVRGRLARRSRRRPVTARPALRRPGWFAPRTALVLAHRLAKRGPPAPVLTS